MEEGISKPNISSSHPNLLNLKVVQGSTTYDVPTLRVKLSVTGYLLNRVPRLLDLIFSTIVSHNVFNDSKPVYSSLLYRLPLFPHKWSSLRHISFLRVLPSSTRDVTSTIQISTVILSTPLSVWFPHSTRYSSSVSWTSTGRKLPVLLSATVSTNLPSRIS